MSSNLKQFTGKVNAWIKASETGIDVKKVQRVLALKALANLSRYTPVDTGYLRFNWILSSGGPDPRAVGVSGAKNPAPAISIPPFPPYSVLYIQNNVEYAEHVENGTPKMEGKFMLKRTLEDLGGDFD